jgi:hypothetical protein
MKKPLYQEVRNQPCLLKAREEKRHFGGINWVVLRALERSSRGWKPNHHKEKVSLQE